MANLCELNRYQIYREVKLHSNLQHENIITLFAAFKQGDQVRATAPRPVSGQPRRFSPVSSLARPLAAHAPCSDAWPPRSQVVLVQEFADSGDLFMLLHR